MSLCLCATVPLFAQCPDGTPPPCAAAVRRTGAARPPGPAERRRQFLVLPFRNISRVTELEWLIEGSPILLADALSGRESLHVVPDERLYPALRRAGLRPGEVMDLGRVRQVAGETGGWTAVTGEVLVLGDRIRVSARAFDVVSNTEVMRAVEEAARGDDIRGAYQRIGTRLLRAAGADTATAVADLAETTTGSLDAYRAFVRGIAHIHRSEARRARDAFLEAVRLDSTFARAWARLAEASMSVSPDLTNPQSPMFAQARRAASLADRLPARDRELVLGMNDMFAGRVGAARARFAALVQRDSNDVDALEWMASVEGFDPILAGGAGRERPRGSINTALRHAKRVLELDPARHNMYENLVQSYLIAAGGTPGFFPTWRQEAPSLAALLNAAPDRTFIPVLRDTLVLVPAESLAIAVPADSLAAARRRALDAARAWLQRWLEVGRSEAQAHVWASRVYDLAGELAPALRALETADSLGVETGLESVPGRRMALLARLGRHADGRRIADSLLRAGGLNLTAMTAYQIEGLGWAYTLFALDGRFDLANTLLDQTATALAPAALLNPNLPADALAMTVLSGAVTQFFSLPLDVRHRVIEQTLVAARTQPPSAPVARLLPFALAMALGPGGEARAALATRALEAAGALAADSTRADLAYELAATVARDSGVRAILDTTGWFALRRAAARAERLATQRRFRPLRVVVGDSTATFFWAAQGDAFSWHRVEALFAEPDFGWTAEFRAAGRSYEVVAQAVRPPGGRPRSGSLQDLLTATRRVVFESSGDTTTSGRPARSPVRDAVVRAEPDSAGFHVVMHAPNVLAALRRERPATMRLRFRPCEADPADPSVGCPDELVPVTYP